MEKQNPFKYIGNPSQEVPEDLKVKVLDAILKMNALLEKKSKHVKKHKKHIVSLFKTDKKPL